MIAPFVRLAAVLVILGATIVMARAQSDGSDPYTLPSNGSPAPAAAQPIAPATPAQGMPAQGAPAAGAPNSATYSSDEILKTGHHFFGSISGGLATVIEQAFAKYGEPNGYILGQEATGALFGGLRYGEGDLYLQGQQPQHVYWQGPSLGFDLGGDGARVMMLVYRLPSIDSLFQRFVGVSGSAYVVGGFGMTLLAYNTTYVAPIRSGVGLRLGINLGYLKFTPQATWNPF